MKKLFAYLLVISSILSFSSCGKRTEQQVKSEEEQTMQRALKILSVTVSEKPGKPALKVRFTGSRPGGYFMKFVLADDITGKALLETVKQLNALSVPNETSYAIDTEHLLRLHSERCLDKKSGQKEFKGQLIVKITLAYEMPGPTQGLTAVSESIKVEEKAVLLLSYEMKDGKPVLKELKFEKSSL